MRLLAPLLPDGQPTRQLRDPPHVVEERLLDLADDLQRLVLLALPDVAAEDHAGATSLHDRPSVREHCFVIRLGASGEDDERAAGSADPRAEGYFTDPEISGT